MTWPRMVVKMEKSGWNQNMALEAIDNTCCFGVGVRRGEDSRKMPHS